MTACEDRDGRRAHFFGIVTGTAGDNVTGIYPDGAGIFCAGQRGRDVIGTGDGDGDGRRGPAPRGKWAGIDRAGEVLSAPKK